MSLKDTITNKAKDEGAESAVDIGVFLLGGAIGGSIDAAIDVFGFAEPMVVAGLMGTGLLGLKKLLFDARTDTTIASRENDVTSRGKESKSSLNAELSALRKLGRNEEAKVLEIVIKKGQENDLDADQVRALYDRLLVQSNSRARSAPTD